MIKTIFKIFVAVACGIYFLNYALHPESWIFISNFDLLIHEAGHWIFSFFGQFMYVLGGSLNQVLIPIIFVIYFFFQNQFYSGALCLFWVGENLINVSVYAGDAVKMQLPLLGGDSSTHDWNWLLVYTGKLHQTTQIATGIRTAGTLVIISALILAIYFALRKNSNEQ